MIIISIMNNNIMNIMYIMNIMSIMNIINIRNIMSLMNILNVMNMMTIMDMMNIMNIMNNMNVINIMNIMNILSNMNIMNIMIIMKIFLQIDFQVMVCLGRALFIGIPLYSVILEFVQSFSFYIGVHTVQTSYVPFGPLQYVLYHVIKKNAIHLI